jgi:hypothetical protein
MMAQRLFAKQVSTKPTMKTPMKTSGGEQFLKPKENPELKPIEEQVEKINSVPMSSEPEKTKRHREIDIIINCETSVADDYSKKLVTKKRSRKRMKKRV